MSGAVPSNNPTGYLGLPERNPPEIITTTRDPLTTDYKNVKLGDFWFNKMTHKFWILVNLANSTAIWDPFAGPTAGTVDTLTGNSGGAVTGDTNGNVNILGSSGQIVVTGSPSTNTLTLSLAGGGTAVDSFAPDTGTNPVVPTAAGLVNVKGQTTPNTSGIQVTGATNELDIAMFSPFLGDFTFTKSSGAATVNLVSQHTGTNTALVSSLANSSGNGAGFFSSGQYDTTKYWNFGMVPTNAGTNAGGYNISYNASSQSDPSAGTPTLRISNTGNVTVPAGDLTVTRAASLPEVLVTQTGGTDFARFRALGTSPKTGFFSSGTSTGPLYWNFGMASTLSNAFCLNTSSSSVAPEGGTIVLQAATTGTVTVPAGDLVVSRNNVGAAVAEQIFNSDNTSALSAAALIVQTGGASGGDASIIMGYSASNDWSLGQDISDSEKFKISRGNALGTNDVITVTTAGAVRMPLQPAFFAFLTAPTSNDKTGDGTAYTVAFDGESFDQASNFSANTFTVPITGKYFLSASVLLANIGAAHSSAQISITVAGATAYQFSSSLSNPGSGRNAAAQYSVTAYGFASLTAADTVIVKVSVSGDTKTVGVFGAASPNFWSWFQGNLVC